MDVELLQRLVSLHTTLAMDIGSFKDPKGDVGYDFEKSKKALAAVAKAIVREAAVVNAD